MTPIRSSPAFRGRGIHRLALLVLVGWTLARPDAASAQRLRAAVDLARPVTYHIDEGTAASGFAPGDSVLARWALEAWARELDPAPRLTPGPDSTATVRVHWVAAGAGQFGETRTRRVGDAVGADVFIHPDASALGADIARRARADPLFRDTVVFLTCVHELGHAFGLPHTAGFEDIMYSFQYGGDFVAYFMRFRGALRARDDIARASPFSPADRDAFRRLQRGAAGG